MVKHYLTASGHYLTYGGHRLYTSYPSALFCPRGSRMLRGPSRRALTIYGCRSGILSRYFDLQTGSCQVSAQTLNSSAFNDIAASGWAWQSYDKVCTALNVTAVSGGGLVASGLGYGTTVMPIGNTAGIVCTAFLVDAVVVPASGG